MIFSENKCNFEKYVLINVSRYAPTEDAFLLDKANTIVKTELDVQNKLKTIYIL